MEERKMEMVLPRNYVEIEQEEMMYLDGGSWTNYYGINAVAKISAMSAISVGAALSAVSAAGKAGLTLQSIAGAIVYGTLSIFFGALSMAQAWNVGQAIIYKIKYNGFKTRDWGIWNLAYSDVAKI
jgi:hypothetical protein